MPFSVGCSDLLPTSTAGKRRGMSAGWNARMNGLELMAAIILGLPQLSLAVDSSLCLDGLIFPIFRGEGAWNSDFRAFLYIVGLLWAFVGIAILSDVFMAGIETITNSTYKKRVERKGADGKPLLGENGEVLYDEVDAVIWNPAVANLTLMALGSSTPELLLAIIETLGANFYSDDLGPGTIIGSAAFNLFVITAVCCMSLGAGVKRKITGFVGFCITSVFSVLAYIWLLIILIVSSPDVVEVWEAVVTLGIMGVLLVLVYIADTHLAAKVTPDESEAKEEEKELEKNEPTPNENRDDEDRVMPVEGSDPFGESKKFEIHAGSSKFLHALAQNDKASDHWKRAAIHAHLMSKEGANKFIDVVRLALAKNHKASYLTYRRAFLNSTFQNGKALQKIHERPSHGGTRVAALEDEESHGSGDAHDGRAEADGSPEPDGASKVDETAGDLDEDEPITWKGQFEQILQINEEGDWKKASPREYISFIITLPWQVLAAFIPPPQYGGGWYCFFVALGMIGGVTAMVGDLASIFGCLVGLHKSVTAITVVALGTSVPDTFASMIAIKMDDTADNALGNITGSNCVNVFLGLGIPWLCAAIKWAVTGPDAQWHTTYQSWARYDQYKETGAFVVEAGSLGFNVLIFAILSIASFFVIFGKRFAFGAEIGGSLVNNILSASLLVLLWLIYIVVASLQVYHADSFIKI